MKNYTWKKKLLASGLAGLAVRSGSAQAALVAADVTALQVAVLADGALAAGVAIVVMTVVLGWDVGISLLKKFTKKGAS